MAHGNANTMGSVQTDPIPFRCCRSTPKLLLWVSRGTYGCWAARRQGHQPGVASCRSLPSVDERVWSGWKAVLTACSCCSLSVLWAELRASADVWPQTCCWYKWFGYRHSWVFVLDELGSIAGGRGQVSQQSPRDPSACGARLSRIHRTSHCGLLRQHIGGIWQLNLPCLLPRESQSHVQQNIYYGVLVLWNWIWDTEHDQLLIFQLLGYCWCLA